MGWRAVWGRRAPTPPAGRCAPVLFDWSFTAGLCAAVSPARPVLPQWQPAVLLGRLAGVLLSRASPGSRKRDNARELLAEVYGWFTEGFETADLQEARALLEELGA